MLISKLSGRRQKAWAPTPNKPSPFTSTPYTPKRLNTAPDALPALQVELALMAKPKLAEWYTLLARAQRNPANLLRSPF